jgi:hypothetical protein
MTPTEKKPITAAAGLVMVTYVCEQCGTETFRTYKDE